MEDICEQENCLPSWRRRFCTRKLKIEPFKAFLLRAAPAIAYVGLRADEEHREGVDYGGDVKLIELGGVQQRYPLQEWGYTKQKVLDYLKQRNIQIPKRTDCARCFFQTLDEWYELWKTHPDIYEDAVQQEAKFGHTFRSPGRDRWPAKLADLRKEFERGRKPRGVLVADAMRKATCRECTL